MRAKCSMNQFRILGWPAGWLHGFKRRAQGLCLLPRKVDAIALSCGKRCRGPVIQRAFQLLIRRTKPPPAYQSMSRKCPSRGFNAVYADGKNALLLTLRDEACQVNPAPKTRNVPVPQIYTSRCSGLRSEPSWMCPAHHANVGLP